MKIKTNLSFNCLAKYSAMMWNHSEEPYMANGENLVEIIKDGEDLNTFVLTDDFLVGDCEWQIEKQENMLEEDEAGACAEWYRDGDRDERTMKGYAIYKKCKKEIASFKRELKKWIKEVEYVDVWEYESDTIDFIKFDGGDKALPNIR